MEMVAAWLLLVGILAGQTKPGARAYRAVAQAAGTGAGYTWGATHRNATSAKTSAKTAPVKKGSRSGSTARGDRPTSIREAARQGFRTGLQAAQYRRATGRDLVGRTRKAVGFAGKTAGQIGGGVGSLVIHTKKARAKRAEKAEKADKLKKASAEQRFFALRNSGYKGAINQDGYAVTNDPPAPAEDTQETKEKDMADKTKGGEMATRSDMKAEAKDLRTAAEAVEASLSALREAAEGFASRYEGAPWGTKPLNDAAAGVTEVGKAKDFTPAALMGTLDGVDAANKEADNLAEVAASQGAYGRVENLA